jgi:hypothetical protein
LEKLICHSGARRDDNERMPGNFFPDDFCNISYRRGVFNRSAAKFHYYHGASYVEGDDTGRAVLLAESSPSLLIFMSDTPMWYRRKCSRK